jgi:DNA polymerase-1
MGRKRYLAGIQSSNAIVRSAAERNAINAPIQGSAADIIKKAMIDIHAELQEKKMKSKMLLQVHDELVFDAHKNEVEALKKLITERMENAFKLPVKLKVDIGWGTNWLEAH